MNIGKTIRKFRRNTRAISPVIATLLMIAIAVVASLVTYAWVMGYMNFTTQKTGNAIQIQTVNQAGGVIYVQNVGTSTVKFSNLATGVVYIDGVAKDVSTTTSGLTSGSLATTKTAVFTLPAASIPISSGQHTIKIVADDGTFNELTKTYP
jgi:flagellin-like protein